MAGGEQPSSRGAGCPRGPGRCGGNQGWPRSCQGPGLADQISLGSSSTLPDIETARICLLLACRRAGERALRGVLWAT